MATPGNPNQPLPQSGPPFDLQKLFRPASPNLTPSSSFPSPAGSPCPFPPNYLPFHPPQQPQNHFNYQQQQQHIASNMPIYPPPPSSNPNSGGARLMSLLSNQNPQPPSPNLDWPQPTLPFPLSSSSLSSSGASDLLMPMNPTNFSAIRPTNLASVQPSPARIVSTKIPSGRHLMDDHVQYDISVRLQGEVQPQLEVTPITKYTSDPLLVLGRQIAVNGTYICYGLKLGNIRVLNINTALRSLLRGHMQRVTDMSFFAEDVHLLASASVDARVFIWKIIEGPDVENKPQITGKVLMALQLVGDWESVHPRLCWHPHKQEILMVGIGNYILRIDTTRVGKGCGFSAEEPLKCPIDKLIDGIQIVGKHGAEVTELSMCQWMTSRLASASVDGTVMVWEDRKGSSVTKLQPHNGDPVSSVKFLTAPDRPDHIVLLTGGLLNREVKIWTSTSEEGWLLPGDADAWLCTQTLELNSSSAARVEDVFFNQVVALPRAGLFLLANAKKNAIYAVHIDYRNYPAATRMDYISEFTVTMPILSLIGTSDGSPDGEHIVQVYCIQTQAIQQYALDLSQCRPPSIGNMGFEKTEFNASHAVDAVNTEGSGAALAGKSINMMPMKNASSMTCSLLNDPETALIVSHPANFTPSEVDLDNFGLETKPGASSYQNTTENIHPVPPFPLSPKLSRKLSDIQCPSSGYESSSLLTNNHVDQPVLNYSVGRKVIATENLVDVPSSCDNMGMDKNNLAQSEKSMVHGPHLVFKHPTHLVTPSEILSTLAAPSSKDSQGTSVEEKVQDAVFDNDAETNEVDLKVVGETGTSQNNGLDAPSDAEENKSNSQASDFAIQMTTDCCIETFTSEGIQQNNDTCVTEAEDQPAGTGGEGDQNVRKEVPTVGKSEVTVAAPQCPVITTKGKRQKGKNSQVSGSCLSSSVMNSDSSNEPSSSSSATAMPQLLAAMQEMLEQLISSQKEMQKQMNVMVSTPITKEGKRLETSLGRSMEKAVKANTDAIWVRLQEENTRHDKLQREHAQQLTNLISNYMCKDLPAMLEKTLKKEVALVGPAIARLVTPVLEKIISSAISESFQKGVGEKAVNQLEKSVNTKLEATVARQIQIQFQTSGKQTLQDALRSTLEASIIPAFEMACKSMFEQVDATFQKGLLKLTASAQQQFESAHSPLAIALRDAINSASSMTQTLSGDLADNQRKLLAVATGNANSQTGNPLVTQLTNSSLHELRAEAPLDPTKELAGLIAEGKFEEAFTAALHRSDVSLVSWLCSQIDLQGILSLVPLPLSQGVLLALLQQLACDINKETPRKLQWMRDVAVVVNPSDNLIAVHARRIFEQVYQILGHQLSIPTTSASEASNIRLLLHVINSMLMGCK